MNQEQDWTACFELVDLFPDRCLKAFMEGEGLSFAAGSQDILVNREGVEVIHIHTLNEKKFLFFLFDGGYLTKKAHGYCFLEQMKNCREKLAHSAREGCPCHH